MEMILAKWVLLAAWVIPAGPDGDYPPLARAPGSGMAVRQDLTVLGPPPCAPGMTCEPRPSAVMQSFCALPGVYTVTVRLGLLAPWGLAGGKVWIEGAGEESLVAAFTAAPGSPAYVAGSLQVRAAGETCYRLRVETSAPVEAIGDPRVSFVSFGR